MSQKRTTRRQFIKRSAIGLAGVATVSITGVAMPRAIDMPEPYPTLQPRSTVIPAYHDRVRFFDSHQYELVATIAALIIPSDDTPGATEAGVVDVIDEMVADSPKYQEIYRQGLQWVDALSRQYHGKEKNFLKLDTAEQIELLRIIDRSNLIHHRKSSNFFTKVDIKLGIFWDEIFGLGENAKFFYHIRRGTIYAFYSSRLSWKGIGYFGPPQPEGYPDFMDPPSTDKITGKVRPIRAATCKTCHQEVKHPVGELIDHSCKRCHRPHKPWPMDESAIHLEDHVGFVFPSPDRQWEEK